MFASLKVPLGFSPEVSEGFVRPGEQKQLQFLDIISGAYYEVDEKLQLTRVDDAARNLDFRKRSAAAAQATKPDYTISEDGNSVLIQTKSARFRLPLHRAGKRFHLAAGERFIREVASERLLANIGGLFYELPRGPDFLRIKPVASHPYAISDYCTWRGLLVLAGTFPEAKPEGHLFKSADNTAALWFGKTDDLWRLGKPVGAGGPWHDTPVQPNTPSDPFLMTNFDRKTLALSHDAQDPVTFTIEVNYMNNETWRTCQRITAPPGKSTTHHFPDGYQAHWVRLFADKPCTATAAFTYE